jgi:RNA-directed DNA polymerase
MRQKPAKVGRAENSEAGSRGKTGRAEAETATMDGNKPPEAQKLIWACVEAENMRAAWKRVKQNDGAAGADGRSVGETAEHIRQHWQAIKRALLEGRYMPRPVRAVEIPKPGGGVRELGIPTVLDRLIQQALLQVLQPIFERGFHPSSFGFRPGRSAHDCLRQAKAYVEEGRRWVADADLEKFFDRVNHDLLMGLVEKRVKDRQVLKLIRRFLEAGIMRHGVCMGREEGTPQGGPISPLLANVLLNEMDWELESRGLKFCRYADDCNVYTQSKASAERALITLRKLAENLNLRLNELKSAADRASRRKFLGFQFWYQKGKPELRVADKTLETFKAKVRSMTGRSSGKSLKQIVGKLRVYLLGWRNYFQLAATPKKFADLDGWIRRRLRTLQLKQWKNGRTTFKNLMARGLPKEQSARISGSRRRYSLISKSPGMNVAFPVSFYDALGMPRLAG